MTTREDKALWPRRLAFLAVGAFITISIMHEIEIGELQKKAEAMQSVTATMSREFWIQRRLAQAGPEPANEIAGPGKFAVVYEGPQVSGVIPSYSASFKIGARETREGARKHARRLAEEHKAVRYLVAEILDEELTQP